MDDDDDDDASKLIFNAAIGNGGGERCVSAFLLLPPRLDAFLFKFTRIGKCQKVHSSLQCEAQLVRGCTLKLKLKRRPPE